MKDIQGQVDKRGIPLDLVGIKNLALPVIIQEKKSSTQLVTSNVTFLAPLNHSQKGHHMSRFIEILNKNTDIAISYDTLHKLLKASIIKLNTDAALLEYEFTYFLKKKSPVTKITNYLDYKCKISGLLKNNIFTYSLLVKTPVMTLCPCSKAISKYNAHNQRSIVTLEVLVTKKCYLEDFIKLVEKQGSCEIYSLLKRPDEKYITEYSYMHPKFVEDVVRDVSLQIKENRFVASYNASCESFESIHAHNAYAFVSNETNK
jgi:GTP cyclohydrolase I